MANVPMPVRPVAGGAADDLLTLIRSRDIAGLDSFFNTHPNKLNEYIFATPLHYATTMSRVEVVKYLVDRGADQSLKILDHFNKTALELAVAKKNQQMIDILTPGPLKAPEEAPSWRKDEQVLGYGHSVAVPKTGGVENPQGLRITGESQPLTDQTR